MNYVAKLFRLISGEFCVTEHRFDRLEDAIECGIKAAVHSFKVYDKDGCCCHDSHHHPHGPYC
jgi:hypothetical protein